MILTGGMMFRWAMLFILAGCTYISRSEFEDQFWDADGDGWSFEEDCDDGNPNIYPGAYDLRGDGCDADCGAEPDYDLDDWPDDSDCEPEDAQAHPCSAQEVDGDNVDSDCDGLDSVREDDCFDSDPDSEEDALEVIEGNACQINLDLVESYSGNFGGTS
jgi:hypothetical protein